MPLRKATLAITITSMGGIFMLDCVAGNEFDLGLLYLVPIGLASFVLGARYGYAMTLAAALLLLAATGLREPGLPSLSAFLSDRGAEATVYVVSVYILGLLRLVVGGARGTSPLDTPSRLR